MNEASRLAYGLYSCYYSTSSSSSCVFKNTGGGGIRLGNQSSEITVQNSLFTQLGQSGVMFTGNISTQAFNCSVLNNTISSFGIELASAGGVYLTSASSVHVAWNNISEGPRWGIHVRSNAHAPSNGNILEYNRINNVALQTRDCGGLSVIDNGRNGDTGTIMRHNCVGHAYRVVQRDEETGNNRNTRVEVTKK